MLSLYVQSNLYGVRRSKARFNTKPQTRATVYRAMRCPARPFRSGRTVLHALKKKTGLRLQGRCTEQRRSKLGTTLASPHATTVGASHHALLEFVGITSLNTSFTTAVVFMKGETTPRPLPEPCVRLEGKEPHKTVARLPPCCSCAEQSLPSGAWMLT